MGTSITIEGTSTPAAGVLATGERKTVQLTSHIQDLLNRGFIREVDRVEDEAVDTDTTVDDPAPSSQPAPPADDAPYEVWHDFLIANIPGVTIPENADRTALIKGWDAYTQQRDGGH